MLILHVERDPYPDDALRRLEASGQVVYRTVGNQAQFLAALREAPYEAVFVRLGVSVDGQALDAALALRVVVTPTTGLAHIDLDAVRDRGVELISLKGETSLLEQVTSTAEHAWALLLGLVRRLPATHLDVMQGAWRRSPWVGAELSGKTLGVIGYGRLGRMVARYGVAFSMRVLAHDRSMRILVDPGVAPCALEELLAESDVVSLHLPLASDTVGFLSAARIGAMRWGAVLVNTARGELVDETALLAALEGGHLAGAALDVLAGDSGWGDTAPPDHRLLAYARRRDNLLITSHVGGYTREATERTRRFVVDRFLAWAPAGVTTWTR